MRFFPQEGGRYSNGMYEYVGLNMLMYLKYSEEFIVFFPVVDWRKYSFSLLLPKLSEYSVKPRMGVEMLKYNERRFLFSEEDVNVDNVCWCLEN